MRNLNTYRVFLADYSLTKGRNNHSSYLYHKPHNHHLKRDFDKWKPINPAEPVIKILFMAYYLNLSLASTRILVTCRAWSAPAISGFPLMQCL